MFEKRNEALSLATKELAVKDVLREAEASHRNYGGPSNDIFVYYLDLFLMCL